MVSTLRIQCMKLLGRNFQSAPMQLASVPGLKEEEEEGGEPGIHCSCIHIIFYAAMSSSKAEEGK